MTICDLRLPQCEEREVDVKGFLVRTKQQGWVRMGTRRTLGRK